MRDQSSRVSLDINKHRHTRGKVPKNMAMEKPDTGIIGPESQNRVPAAGNLDSIAQRGARQIVGLDRIGVWVEAGGNDVFKGII
jgi:hypothetical protein